MTRYYITDRRALGGVRALLDNIASVLACGVEQIQIREKDLAARDLVELVRQVLQLAVPRGVRVFINDRTDVALACGAHGTHLRSTSISPVTLRKIVPPGFLIGVSCHSALEVRKAEQEGANFAVLGPVFVTPGKEHPIGLPELEEAAHSVSMQVLALGGITSDRVDACIQAGAAGVAGIRMFQCLGR